MYPKLLRSSTELLLQFICILSLIFVLLWYWKRRHLYRFACKVPTCWGLPIFGILPQIGHVNNLMAEIENSFKQKCSNNVCIWLGVHAIMCTRDSEFINAVLINPKYFEKSNIFYQPFVEVLGENLVTTSFEKWKSLRDEINLNFKRAEILNYFVIFNKARKICLENMENIADGKPHKLAAIVYPTLLSISLEAILGLKTVKFKVFNELIKSFAVLNDIIMVQTFAAFFHLERIGIFYRRRTYKKLFQIAKDLVEEAILNAKGSTPVEKKSRLVVERLLESFESKDLSWENMISESIAMIVASFETVANTLVAALAMLATHPDKQSKLYAQLKEFIFEADCDIDYGNLTELSYLDLVLKEVLRLYPPFPFVARELRRNTHIEQYPLELPQNLQIMISIYHLHRRPDIWGEDAACFRPERFRTEELTMAQRKAYMPFSRGPRNCVGWRYAQFLLKVIIGGIVRSYETSTDVKFEDLKVVDHTTLKFLNEPNLVIRKRN